MDSVLFQHIRMNKLLSILSLLAVVTCLVLWEGQSTQAFQAPHVTVYISRHREPIYAGLGAVFLAAGLFFFLRARSATLKRKG